MTPGPPGGGNRPLRLGVIGAGGFATMVAESTRGLDGIRLHAVADERRDRAEEFAAAYGGRVANDRAGVLDADDIDVVVVTTPPSTHATIVVSALWAGKHVFCEKPLATSAADARSVIDAWRQAGRVVVVDHVLRHNPLLAAVARLSDAVLGPPQRFLYENDASDEQLGTDHWFWDESVSGGILLEHAVHAFDAAHWLLGSRPMSVQATTARRPGLRGDDGVVDLVTTTALHPGGVLATHTHSFTHAERCERQLMRLDHGTAETRVHGWIPVDAQIDLWTDDAGVDAVLGLVDDVPALMAVGHAPGEVRAGGEVGAGAVAGAQARVERDAGSATARARGLERKVPHRVRIDLTLGGESAKQAVYAASVRSAMADLVRCVHSGEEPVSGVMDAAAAVIVAAAATRAARSGSTVSLLQPPPPDPITTQVRPQRSDHDRNHQAALSRRPHRIQQRSRAAVPSPFDGAAESCRRTAARGPRRAERRPPDESGTPGLPR